MPPAGSGTMIGMEQAGFGPDQDLAYKGSRAAWTHYLAALEKLVATID